jgi:RimJ/RimL family protein N-acetyltransferase
MRHLVAIAHEAGLEELVADVLPDNIPMLKVLEKSGLPMTTRHEAEVTSVRLRLS